MPPSGTDFGARPDLTCGSSLATRDSIVQTRSGGSSGEKTVETLILCTPGGRLRFVNDATAKIELGVICNPDPVSMCTARQLTSTTRPRAADVSIQSPSLNGC